MIYEKINGYNIGKNYFLFYKVIESNDFKRVE